MSTPFRRRSLALLVSLGTLLWVTACPKQHRRQDPDQTSESSEQPSESVDPAGDPRFPGEGDSDRRGFWVDQPTRSGAVSPTGLANAVASKLPDVRNKCCRANRCLGFDGRLLVQLTVAPNGKVRSAEISETSIYERDFQNCLEKAAGSWNVPKPGSGRKTEAYIAINARIPHPGSDSGRDSDAKEKTDTPLTTDAGRGSADTR